MLDIDNICYYAGEILEYFEDNSTGWDPIITKSKIQGVYDHFNCTVDMVCKEISEQDSNRTYAKTDCSSYGNGGGGNEGTAVGNGPPIGGNGGNIGGSGESTEGGTGMLNNIDNVVYQSRNRKKRQASGKASGGNEDDDGGGSDITFASEDVKYEAEFLKSYLSLKKDTRKNISHHLTLGTSRIGSPIRGMVVGCTYSGKDCLGSRWEACLSMENSIENKYIPYTHRYWTETTSPSYGTCFTFNSAKKVGYHQIKKASLTGITNGLSIEMFLDQTNYMINKLSKRSGVRLVLHDPKIPPLPEEYGLDLAPNTASSISVQLVSCITYFFTFFLALQY